MSNGFSRGGLNGLGELQKGTLVIIRSKCEEENELPGEPIGVDGLDSMVTRGIGVAGKEQTVFMAVNSAKPMNGWGRVALLVQNATRKSILFQ
jgi:hypothetical protein